MIMTIDEVIENLKYDVEIDMYIRDIAPQLAEWLEDYKRIKMLIPIEQALKAEYNKSIDDFIKAADKHCGYYAGECKNLTRDDLLKIAKELKDNG